MTVRTGILASAVCGLVAFSLAAIGAVASIDIATRLRLLGAALCFVLVAIIPVSALALRSARALRALRPVDRSTSIDRKAVEALKAEMRSNKSAIESLRREVRNSGVVEKVVTRRLDLLYRQIEALLALYSELSDERFGLPSLRKWAVSPDLALFLVRRIHLSHPTVLVETGSGSSTVIMAKALQSTGSGHLYAIEHDSNYAARTRSELEARGLNEFATVILCPLTSIDESVDQKIWYDISGLELSGPIDLLLVDGPPGATAPGARSLVLDGLAPWLRPGTEIIVDDTIRDDESTMVETWASLGLVAKVEKLAFEKGVAVMRYVKGQGEHSARG